MINDPRHLIKETLSERISLNPSYSLRAFARDLKISPQQLSNFLNGKRGISEKVAAHIAQRLGLSEEETARFCQTISAQFSRSKTKKAIATAHLKQFELNEGLTKNLELDFFKTISQWHHLGLMELIKISKNKSSTKLFSKRLGIPETEILMSLQRLERLELITKTAQGWKLNQDTVIADKGIPSEAIRHFHQQLLEKSILALRFQTQDERYGRRSARAEVWLERAPVRTQGRRACARREQYRGTEDGRCRRRRYETDRARARRWHDRDDRRASARA
jgi:uncharacterized protein (TIGR02147 family)